MTSRSLLGGLALLALAPYASASTISPTTVTVHGNNNGNNNRGIEWVNLRFSKEMMLDGNEKCTFVDVTPNKPTHPVGTRTVAPLVLRGNGKTVRIFPMVRLARGLTYKVDCGGTLKTLNSTDTYDDNTTIKAPCSEKQRKFSPMLKRKPHPPSGLTGPKATIVMEFDRKLKRTELLEVEYVCADPNFGSVKAHAVGAWGEKLVVVSLDVGESFEPNKEYYLEFGNQLRARRRNFRNQCGVQYIKFTTTHIQVQGQIANVEHNPKIDADGIRKVTLVFLNAEGVVVPMNTEGVECLFLPMTEGSSAVDATLTPLAEGLIEAEPMSPLDFGETYTFSCGKLLFTVAAGPETGYYDDMIQVKVDDPCAPTTGPLLVKSAGPVGTHAPAATVLLEFTKVLKATVDAPLFFVAKDGNNTHVPAVANNGSGDKIVVVTPTEPLVGGLTYHLEFGNTFQHEIGTAKNICGVQFVHVKVPTADHLDGDAIAQANGDLGPIELLHNATYVAPFYDPPQGSDVTLYTFRVKITSTAEVISNQDDLAGAIVSLAPNLDPPLNPAQFSVDTVECKHKVEHYSTPHTAGTGGQYYTPKYSAGGTYTAGTGGQYYTPKTYTAGTGGQYYTPKYSAGGTYGTGRQLTGNGVSPVGDSGAVSCFDVAVGVPNGDPNAELLAGILADNAALEDKIVEVAKVLLADGSIFMVATGIEVKSTTKRVQRKVGGFGDCEPPASMCHKSGEDPVEGFKTRVSTCQRAGTYYNYKSAALPDAACAGIPPRTKVCSTTQNECGWRYESSFDDKLCTVKIETSGEARTKICLKERDFFCFDKSGAQEYPPKTCPEHENVEKAVNFERCFDDNIVGCQDPITGAQGGGR